MQKQAEPAYEDMIRAQLTLRAVIWDITKTDSKETAKLDQEWSRYQVRKIPVSLPGESAGRQADYEMILADLCRAGLQETDSLLVTEDEQLASYVYHRHHLPDEAEACMHPQNPWQNASESSVHDSAGMAVVFYEKENAKKHAAADMTVQGFEEIGIQFLDRVHKRRNHLPWNILYTKRTCVREICLADLDALYEMYQEKGITDYTEPLFERLKEEEYTKNYIKWMYYYYGYGMWVVCDRKTGRLIGRAGIEHHDTEDGGMLMELGYIIARSYQNQGYAQEVCRAVLEYAAQELEIEEIHCFIHNKNMPSVRVAEKLEFTLYEKEYSPQEYMLHYYKKLSP